MAEKTAGRHRYGGMKKVLISSYHHICAGQLFFFLHDARKKLNAEGAAGHVFKPTVLIQFYSNKSQIPLR